MTKPPTVRDVARLAGLSTATVSRYFGGKVDALAPETVEIVRKAAEELGYTPSEIGRSLRLAQSRVVVVIVPDDTNHFTLDVASSVEQALKECGLSMVLAISSEDPDQQDRLLADAQGLRAKAIVMQAAIDTPRLRELSERQSNLIFVNRRPASGINGPYVGIDNYNAGLVVGRHFRAKGYENCVAISGPRQYFGSSERVQGFVEGFGDAASVIQLESAYTMEGGFEHGRRLLLDRSKRYSIFCANDMVAYGLHRAACEAGFTVPDDIVIFGFDDNRLNDWLAPWLSTVHVPAFEFGPAIVDLITSPEASREIADVILPFSLKIRNSG